MQHCLAPICLVVASYVKNRHKIQRDKVAGMSVEFVSIVGKQTMEVEQKQQLELNR